MLLSLYTYNGHAINDTTNYVAWFPPGEPSMPKASPNWAPRSRTWAKLSSKNISGATLQIYIECKGTIHTQLEELKAWFPVDDFTPRTLIVKDTADSNRQWYVKGYATEAITPQSEGAGGYIITLAIDEPLWRTVTPSTDTWLNIATNPATKSLTVLGNQVARPIFSIAIGAAKAGGYAKKVWKPTYNPLTVSNSTPYEVTRGGLNTSALIADTSVSNQINNGAGITSGALTIAIDTSVGGGLATGGGMCYVDTEQIYYTSISAGSMTVYDDGAGTTGRGWGGTTAASHADNAVLKRSQMMANGNDLRVFDGNTEIDRYITGINTTTTKIWILPTFLPDLTMTLDTALAGAGTPSTITVKKTTANLAALKRLPPTFMCYIGSEVFICSNPLPASYKMTLIARNAKGTSIAAHASGATIRWLEHDFYIVYGNALADTPTPNTNKQPILDMTNSTNTSWVYTELKSADELRSGGWKTNVIKQVSPKIDTAEGNSRIFTGSQNTDADPATELGFMIKAFQQNAVWKAETFQGTISLYHPAGFTTVTITGNKYRYAANWPSITFQKSAAGVSWATVFTEATPASSGSWGAVTAHSAVTLSGTYPYIRWYANATLPGSASNAVGLEMTGATLVIDSTKIPQEPFSTSTADNYHIDTTISVTETGDSIRLVGVAAVSSTIIVNCDTETITLDGDEGKIGISWNTEREGWLDLPSPKQSATCTLKYEESGVADVDISLSWENRSAL